MNKEQASKLLFMVICASLAASLVFLYGVAVGNYKIFPYDTLRTMLNLASDRGAMQMALGLRPTEFLHPARHEGRGVTVNRPGEAAPGLTFISGFFEDGAEMRLIRLDGSVVHRWPVRFSAIWPEPEHIRPERRVPRTDWNTDVHGALVQPDGSVVFNFEYHGMVKLDRCGDPEWKLDHMTHHSLEPASDGGFWVPGRRYVDGGSDFAPLEAPYHEDLILKVSAEGAIVEEISVPALLYEDELRALFLANGQTDIRVPELELVHLNDIEELAPDIADRFPLFAAGDLMVSLRELNLVMVIDPDRREVKWHRVGPWLRQHDPDFLPDGTILVYDNNSDDTDTGSVFGGSRIIRFDPRNDRWTIAYTGDDFFTNIRGKQQPLANGNTLITEFEAGRAFEVDEAGTVVWEFINRYDDDEVAEVTQATRYPESYFTVDRWACD